MEKELFSIWALEIGAVLFADSFCSRKGIKNKAEQELPFQQKMTSKHEVDSDDSDSSHEGSAETCERAAGECSSSAASGPKMARYHAGQGYGLVQPSFNLGPRALRSASFVGEVGKSEEHVEMRKVVITKIMSSVQEEDAEDENGESTKSRGNECAYDEDDQANSSSFGAELEKHKHKMVGALRDYVKKTVDRRGEAVMDAIKRNFDQHGGEIPRKVFDQLLSIGGVHHDENRSPGELSEELWRERTVSWLDTMTPEGRKWFSVAIESSVLDKDVDFAFAFENDAQIDEDIEHQILLDLPRTYPGVEYFDDTVVLLSLHRILRATAITLPEVGYVQGMNFMAAFLMLHTKTDQDAHRLLVELLGNPRYNLRLLFGEGLPSLEKLTGILSRLIQKRSPRLHRHLDDIELGDFHFSFQWFFTLFAYTMPFDALVHVWDLFFEKSWEGFFMVAVTLLKDNEKDLLKADFENAFLIIKQAAWNPKVNFYKRARRVKLSRDEIDAIKTAVS